MAVAVSGKCFAYVQVPEVKWNPDTIRIKKSAAKQNNFIYDTY